MKRRSEWGQDTLDEHLPGRWVDLKLTPAMHAAGPGPAMGFLAGALAAGRPLWSWPDWGWLLLGLFLVTAVWGRLWTRCGEAPWLHAAGPGPAALDPGRGTLPYSLPGSLSARWESALRRAWAFLHQALTTPGSGWMEVLGLGALLLLVAGLRGHEALLGALLGLALLGLRRLVRGRPAALAFLLVLGGMAWPWWVGHLAWVALSGESVLLSMLWGTSYAAWATLRGEGAAGRPLLVSDAAQGVVVLFFLLSGRPVVGTLLAMVLFAQVLVQVALLRAGRRAELSARLGPLIALGAIGTGLACGGWV